MWLLDCLHPACLLVPAPAPRACSACVMPACFPQACACCSQCPTAQLSAVFLRPEVDEIALREFIGEHAGVLSVRILRLPDGTSRWEGVCLLGACRQLQQCWQGSSSKPPFGALECASLDSRSAAG